MTSNLSARYVAILILLFLGQESCTGTLPGPILGIKDRGMIKSSAAHISGVYGSCKIFRAVFYSYLYKQCTSGTTDFRELYNQRMKQLEGKAILSKCKIGDFDTVKQKLIEFGRGKGRGFLINCNLIDPQIMTKACSLAQKGYSKLFIANTLNLRIKQVDHFLKSCPEPALTEVQKEAICLMKKYGLTALRISKLLGPVFKENTIQSHMDTC